LEILGSTNLEEFVERIAIYLLNSLACQVEGEHKKLVGDLGAITKMLHIIEDRLSKQDCDDVMEIAWSTMWNVTDERPENCERFLNRRGMELFLKCLNAFPNKPELRRNMMGLLGNVAEVKSLRPQLMTSEFINVFYHLLDSTQDNIEVSYNAAGVLAHVLSDGVEAWTIETPWRTDVLESIRRNIKRWDVNSNRNINYRSFEPILRLLNVTHTTECQLWAAWALANLTKVYPEKYVSILVKEGGLDLLTSLRCEDEDVLNFASITLTQAQSFLSTNKI
jgi:Zyg-11 family protein